MRKFAIIIALLIAVSIGINAEALDQTSEINTLKIQLEHSNQLKDHYQKMAVYSETAEELANIEVANYKSYTANLIDNLKVYQAQLDLAVENRVATETHYNQLLAGYENQTYMAVEESRAKEIKLEQKDQRISELETQLSNQFTVILIVLIGMFICLVLFSIGTIKNASIKLEIKPDVEPAVEPLKTFKKDGGKHVAKLQDSDGTIQDGTTKTDDTKIKSFKSKRANQNKSTTKPTAEPKIDLIKPPTRYEAWVNKRLDLKEAKRLAKLEKARTKHLTAKAGEQTFEESPIEANNKKVMFGSLGKTIQAILGIFPKEPVEPPLESKPEVVKDVTPKTEEGKKNEPKSTKKSTPRKKNKK